MAFSSRSGARIAPYTLWAMAIFLTAAAALPSRAHVRCEDVFAATYGDQRKSRLENLARLSLEVENQPASNEKSALLEDLRAQFTAALKQYGPEFRTEVLTRIEVLRQDTALQSQITKDDQARRDQKIADDRKKAEGPWSKVSSHKIDSFLENPKDIDFIGSRQMGLVLKGQFAIYDFAQKKIVRSTSIPKLSGEGRVRISRDGQTAWIKNNEIRRDFFIHRVDLKTMKVTHQYEEPNDRPLSEIILSPDERHLAVTTEEQIKILDPQTLKEVYDVNIDSHTADWRKSRFSADGKYFLSNDVHGNLVVMDLTTGQNVNIKNAKKITDVVFVAGQDAVIAVRTRGLLRIDLKDGSSRVIKTPYIIDGPLRISKDGSRLLILHETDKTAHLWDLTTGADRTAEFPAWSLPRLYAETRDSSYLILQDGSNPQNPHLIGLDAADFTPAPIFMKQTEGTATADRMITEDRSGIVHFHHPGAFEFTE